MVDESLNRIIRTITEDQVGPYIVRDQWMPSGFEWFIGPVWKYINFYVDEYFPEFTEAEFSEKTMERLVEAINTAPIKKIILLAYVASNMAKKNYGMTPKNRLYAFKGALINIAIVYFFSKMKIYFVGHVEDHPEETRPYLLISNDRENNGNIILSFCVDGAYYLDENTGLLIESKLGHSFISLHLPKNKLLELSADIIEEVKKRKRQRFYVK